MLFSSSQPERTSNVAPSSGFHTSGEGETSRDGMYSNTSLFSSIREAVGDLSPYNENTFHSEAPAIPVKDIAKAVGVRRIRRVRPKRIKNLHASLEKTAKGFTILVNGSESKEEQRFSIAHEIQHFLAWKKRGKPVFLESAFSSNKTVIAVRNNYYLLDKVEDTALKIRGKSKDSQFMADYVSSILGKPVSSEKTEAIFTKHRDKGNSAIQKSIKELIEEEIADYFAANLLVPTEQFLLWEHKEDDVIAKAFEVPMACIKKRRDELEHELCSLEVNPADIPPSTESEKNNLIKILEKAEVDGEIEISRFCIPVET